ncbi:MAG: L,D-transpeptidase ErfK/SrfK [Acidobacteriota bacterium]|nr:L,D-transpeptidase ErfK/SrfK [Acidobacteriota bacterium]
MLARRILREPVTVLALFVFAAGVGAASAQQSQPTQPQNFARYDRFESEREDTLTGGHIERAQFEAARPDIKLTLNVPSFRLTLWQDGKEVKSYNVGVGMKDYPIYIGERKATEVIWNPPWIPPASDWVSSHKGVRPGEVIKASDPRNPLGKVKIPLGDGYLIHQAKGLNDLGNLVSHGCVRMLRTDLYDLAEKIVAARSLPVTRKQIATAKAGTKPLVATLDSPLDFDINYDTLVVEGGVLYIYPDVYDRRTNTVARLRDELRTNGVDDSALDDGTLERMLSSVTRRTKFVVDVRSIEQGRALADGHTEPLLGGPPKQTRPAGRRRAVANIGR